MSVVGVGSDEIVAAGRQPEESHARDSADEAVSAVAGVSGDETADKLADELVDESPGGVSMVGGAANEIAGDGVAVLKQCEILAGCAFSALAESPVGRVRPI